MAEYQLPLITSETAENARIELLSALQAADNPAAWMIFMESVTRLLPEILSSGRPSADAIANSAIGRLGFSSWQAMVEAPTDAHGLGWNFYGWKGWRRAWSVVQEHPWLRDQPFSSSEINTWAKDFKPFPDSLEALQALRVAKVSATEQKRTDALKEAQVALAEALGRLRALEGQVRQERETNAGLTEEVGRLRSEIVQLQVELGILKSTPAPVKLSRFQHLRAFLFGTD